MMETHGNKHGYGKRWPQNIWILATNKPDRNRLQPDGLICIKAYTAGPVPSASKSTFNNEANQGETDLDAPQVTAPDLQWTWCKGRFFFFANRPWFPTDHGVITEIQARHTSATNGGWYHLNAQLFEPVSVTQFHPKEHVIKHIKLQHHETIPFLILIGLETVRFSNAQLRVQAIDQLFSIRTHLVVWI